MYENVRLIFKKKEFKKKMLDLFKKSLPDLFNLVLNYILEDKFYRNCF